MTVQATNSLIPQQRNMHFTPKPVGVIKPDEPVTSTEGNKEQNPGAVNINEVKNAVIPVVEKAGNTFRNVAIAAVVAIGATIAIVKSKGIPAVKKAIDNFYVKEIKTITSKEDLEKYYDHLLDVSQKKVKLKFKRIHREFNLTNDAIKNSAEAESQKLKNVAEIKDTINYVLEIKQRFAPKEGIMPTISINLRECDKKYLTKISKDLEEKGRAEDIPDEILKHISSISFDLQPVKGLKACFKGSNAVQIHVSTTEHIKKRDYINTTAKFFKEFILPW